MEAPVNKVKVEVPKVRRNTAEVRPYNEVGGNQNADHLLLWGTTAGLFAMMLAGGAFLWSQGRTAASPAAPSTQIQRHNLTAAAALDEARQHYRSGDYDRAETSVRLALALQSASESQPSIETEARRLNGQIHQQTGRYERALQEWRWLRKHGATHADLRNLELCERAAKRATERVALEQLRGAQKLVTQSGNGQRALAEAQQALRTLQAQHVEKSSLQAAHLVVANIALQQGKDALALESLRSASALGSLTQAQRSVLTRLERQAGPAVTAAPPRPATASAAPDMQVKVVIPRLADEASYPQGAPSSAASGRKNPQPPTAPGEEDEEEDGPVAPVARRPGGAPPRVELPKLQMPSQGGQSLPSYQTKQGDSLPSYQSGSGSSLPSYSEKTRTRDTLPGY
jgi:tetratricopeptide (TPR) repeat protein